jgi:hypothetical protein
MEVSNMATKFAQRHYVAIAAIVAETAQVYKGVPTCLPALVDKLCIAFYADNPKFKESKFREACKPR